MEVNEKKLKKIIKISFCAMRKKDREKYCGKCDMPDHDKEFCNKILLEWIKE